MPANPETWNVIFAPSFVTSSDASVDVGFIYACPRVLLVPRYASKLTSHLGFLYRRDVTRDFGASYFLILPRGSGVHFVPQRKRDGSPCMIPRKYAATALGRTAPRAVWRRSHILVSRIYPRRPAPSGDAKRHESAHRSPPKGNAIRV